MGLLGVAAPAIKTLLAEGLPCIDVNADPLRIAGAGERGHKRNAPHKERQRACLFKPHPFADGTRWILPANRLAV